MDRIYQNVMAMASGKIQFVVIFNKFLVLDNIFIMQN